MKHFIVYVLLTLQTNVLFAGPGAGHSHSSSDNLLMQLFGTVAIGVVAFAAYSVMKRKK